MMPFKDERYPGTLPQFFVVDYFPCPNHICLLFAPHLFSKNIIQYNSYGDLIKSRLAQYCTMMSNC